MEANPRAEAERALRQADEIADAAASEIRIKYPLGQIEHGGDLFRKPGAIGEAKKEAVDLFTYLYVAAHQHAAALALLDEAASRYKLPAEVAAARNILRSGNPEGLPA